MLPRLVVVLVVAALVVVALPRRQDRAVPVVEYVAELAAARGEAPYHLLAPDPLPSGWHVTGVRYDGDVKGAATWHFGLVTDGRRFAGIAQSNGKPRSFVYHETSRGRPAGSADVDGVTWEKRYREHRDVHSLVRVEHGVTTVLSGNADFGELAELARSLR
jgi:hypothetical protein